MNKITTLITSFVFLFSSASAQMWNGVDTLYGNEWIEYDQSHFKIMVAEDGLYRVDYQTLVDQGIPLSTLQGNQLQIFQILSKKWQTQNLVYSQILVPIF